MESIAAVAQKTKYLKIMSYSQSVLNTLLILGSIVYYCEDINIWFSLYHLAAYIMIFIIFYILFDFCVKNSSLHEFQTAYYLYEQQLENRWTLIPPKSSISRICENSGMTGSTLETPLSLWWRPEAGISF